MESLGMVQEAKIVVALDFGTTFSGFAYALRADPDNVYTFYDWPKQGEGGGLPYCKTQTSLLYAKSASGDSDDTFELREWGWPACVEYKSMNSSVSEPGHGAPEFEFEVVDDIDELASPRDSKKPRNPTSANFLTLFKLHLFTKDSCESDDTASAAVLPPGMTARRAITDYLSEIAKFILEEVRSKFGIHITLDDVQWCVTVPAIWDEQAKREMRHYCEMAGLVQGRLSKDAGSPHQLKLFIEPEAASVYCQQKLKDHEWKKGDKFLVVDCGGGTVDLVLQEKLGSAPTLSVREMEESSGGLCGGSLVDEEFFRFLKRKISCFNKFESEHPATVLEFRQVWERIKFGFDNEKRDVPVELPPKLASMWEEQQTSSAMRRISITSWSFDEVVLTNGDIRSMFDPVVNRILQLVEERMVPDLQAIMVVGGFSASPYLMRRIRDTFGGRVAAIVSPPDPGSAVCRGAVTMGIQSGIVVSRISKKTYGIRQAKPFIAGVHNEEFKVEGDSGMLYCNNVFGKFVRKGDEVCNENSVSNIYFPLSEKQDKLSIDLYSSDSENVMYVTDIDSKKEGTFTIRIPTHEDLGFMPKVEVSMFFGRTEIQVTAIGTNFDSEKEMLPVKFEKKGIF